MKLETMSKNVVNVMITLARNEMLGRLLLHDVDNPYDLSLPKPDMGELIRPDSSKAKIFPYPFNPDATEEDGSFIRVYYNIGEFNGNEVIAESELHIDIIVSKRLWLINNGDESIVRPYDIAGRVIDLVGRNSINSLVKLKFDGFQHLYINTQFDCVRLFAKYMSVETK
ncbi:hypothetical protein FKN04_12390 [Bacillus glycinifermentans]|uniref:hypothetical protein n=1 Tax=Bacillus TaxID=1386 RepID=UPI001581D995|nr:MULTISPECIES: hypothetical protein [Bacillus]NUJ17379.1 hypothetical protein [Bacillus glycinifermentans]GIN66339.1 hypothetical protein J41TS2_17600 [Bacillus sonorensis]